MDNKWILIMYWIYGQYMDINDVLNIWKIHGYQWWNIWTIHGYQWCIESHESYIYIWTIHGYQWCIDHMDNTWVSMMYLIYVQYKGINDVLNPINPINMDNTWVSMMYWIYGQYMGINDVLNPINPICIYIYGQYMGINDVLNIWTIHGYQWCI